MPQQGDAHRVHRHPIRSRQDHIGIDQLALVGTTVDEGLHTIQHNKIRMVGSIDLGNHAPLVRGTVQLAHEVVGIAGNGFRRQSYRVLQRQSEVAAVAVRLETAGLNDAAGAPNRTRQGESLLLVAVRQLDQLPIVGT